MFHVMNETSKELIFTHSFVQRFLFIRLFILFNKWVAHLSFSFAYILLTSSLIQKWLRFCLAHSPKIFFKDLTHHGVEYSNAVQRLGSSTKSNTNIQIHTQKMMAENCQYVCVKSTVSTVQLKSTTEHHISLCDKRTPATG